jgi:hypothetical protein
MRTLLAQDTYICVIICSIKRAEDFVPLSQPLQVVQSNMVYLSQEALLISFSLVSRPTSAIRWKVMSVSKFFVADMQHQIASSQPSLAAEQL